MDEFKYTNEMYEEDRKLICFAIRKYFCWYDKISQIKDDLVAYCLMYSVKIRQKFDDSSGKFSSYAIKSHKHNIRTYFVKHNIIDWKNNFIDNNISLNDSISNSEDDTELQDTLKDKETDFDSPFVYTALKEYIEIAKDKCTLKKSGKIRNNAERDKQIIDDYIDGQSLIQIGKKLGVSREYIRQIMDRFRKYLKILLIENGFYTKNYFDDSKYACNSSRF